MKPSTVKKFHTAFHIELTIRKELEGYLSLPGILYSVQFQKMVYWHLQKFISYNIGDLHTQLVCDSNDGKSFDY